MISKVKKNRWSYVCWHEMHILAFRVKLFTSLELEYFKYFDIAAENFVRWHISGATNINVYDL